MENNGLKYSEVESNRFGLRIYRGQYEDFDTKDVDRITHDNDFDVIIVRFPTETIFEHYRLVDFANCKTIHADSLVYYSAPLQEIEIKPLRNDLEFEVLGDGDESKLESVLKQVFAGYQNHYYSNPCLSRQAIIEGYLEWALSFSKSDDKGITWLIKDRNTRCVVAFLACSYDKTESVSELKLGGVLPDFEGRGVYSDFVRYAQHFFKEMGIRTLLTSTQLQNIAVQRAWQRHCFRFDKSYETYHIVNENLWKMHEVL